MDLSGQKFVRGVELTNGRFVVNSQDPGLDIKEQPHTGFCYWSETEGWTEIGLAGRLTADATTTEDGAMMIMMDPTGFMHEADGETVNKEFIKDLTGEIPKAPFRAIRNVAGTLYAVGVDRQAYIRKQGSWQMISNPDLMTGHGPVAFQSVAGFQDSEIYTAGWDGEIFRFDSTNWHQIESPTNVVLNDICVGEDCCVAVGLTGKALIGRHDDWAVIPNDATDEAFWSVRYFNGSFYMTALSGIYRIADGQIELVREIDDEMRTVYALSTGPSGLWSVGVQDIVLFDGTNWRTLAQS